MDLAVVVLGLPFLAFAILAVVSPLRRHGRVAGGVSILAMAGAFVAAVTVWQRDLQGERLLIWLPGDAGPIATVGLLLDPLTNAMLVLITLVSLLVQIYSLGYLADEPLPALGRYYTYQALFAGSMLGLVLSPTFLQMFVFWELVGLCSYLLIGYWYDRPAAARAALKAFWITKLGDLGFILGIVMLWGVTGTFEFSALFRLAATGNLPAEGLGVILFLIYLGAVGKSAQFPLHVWLPDAMEGPTPVSALIHAATMVTAGVFMVTRAYPLFAQAPEVLVLIGTIGALTALLAATMACVEGDIKRVLAYSTVSQLGYMMAAVGAGAPEAGFFHLLIHGVFKALLFLAAGSVIHAVGTNDVFRMGGLGRAMPHTTVVFIVGTLALAGLPPLAGFFSKEAILAGVWEAGRTWVFLTLAVTAFLTAFYMFRVVVLAFFGHARAGGHPHEAPWIMRGPVWVLAVLTVALGLFFTVAGAPAAEVHHPPGWLIPVSIGLAVGGILLAWATYQRGAIDPADLSRTLAIVDFAARRRYGLDAVYNGLYRGFMLGFSRLVGWIDRYLVDGLLNVASAWSFRAGERLRWIQTGQAQDYVYGVAFGVLTIIVVAHWWS